MNYDIVEALGQIAREKSVDREMLIETLGGGPLSAAKKKFGANAQVMVKFDDQKGGIEMWLAKNVVEAVEDDSLQMTLAQAREINPKAQIGEEVRIPLEIAEFGRNAIQAAKQVLVQRVREAEREMVYDEYIDKVGTLVRGVVQQVDRGSVIVKINLTEAVIPARELITVQLSGAARPCARVRPDGGQAEQGAPGHPFALHPASGQTVRGGGAGDCGGYCRDKSVALEAGHRSKIAVYSRDDRIDAVGACVGIKGSRVQAIVRELGESASTSCPGARIRCCSSVVP